MTDPLLALDGPVFTVGGELNRDLARDCLQLEVEEGVEGLRTLRAQFAAVGAGATGPQDRMLYVDGKVVDFGRTLQVAVGPESGQRTVFDGVVSGLELVLGDSEPPRLVVFAEDALMRLRMTRRSRTYRRVTDTDLVDQVAQEHGLDTDLKVDGPRYDVVQQLNQSDLAFLRDRARLVQGELWCTGKTLHFSTRPRRAGTKLTLAQGTDLLSTRVLADLAHQRSEVAVTGYDVSSKATIDERAGADTIAAEVTAGRTGPSIVTRALGDQRSCRRRRGSATRPGRAPRRVRGRRPRCCAGPGASSRSQP